MKTGNIFSSSVCAVCIALIVVILGGCKSQDIMMDDPFFEKWQSIKEESQENAVDAYVEIAQDSETDDVLFVTLSLDDEETKSLPTMIVKDINLTEKTSVAVVLRTLAVAGDQNILIGEGVTQVIQVNFNNVPWDEAFNSIMSSAGLSYEWEGDIIRVMSLADLQRQLEVDRLQQESKALKSAIRQVEPMQVRMIRIKFSNAEKLGKIIGEILEGRGSVDGPRGSVTVDVESNVIVIHAIADELDKITEMIAKLDRPRAQVLIKSKIVETNRSTARELGIQWGGGAQGISGNNMHTLSGVGLGGFGVNVPAALDDSVGFQLGYMVEQLTGSGFLEVQLTALQEDGKINVLSSPSITTLDNEKAMIEAGEERAYRESSGTGNNLDVSIEWKTATLKLEVTPHVIDSNLLKLDIVVNKDSFDDTKPASSGEFPVNTKKALTTLLLRNGETTVIGGLSQEATSDAVRGVPFLKDIPLIGKLFQSRATGTKFDEIMIFITPQILSDKALFAVKSVSAGGDESETTE